MTKRIRKKQNENNILRILFYTLAILLSVLLLVYRPLLGIITLCWVIIIIAALNRQKTSKTEKNTIVENNNEENKILVDDNKITVGSKNYVKKNNKEEYRKVMEENKSKLINYDSMYANYKLPSITLLSKPINRNIKEQEEEIRKNIGIIEKTLKDFDVYAKVVEVHVGPFITQYELELKAGTRINKIASIHGEIAVALGTKDIKIEAPIPGKSAVGIDVPNKKSNPIVLREALTALPKDKISSKLTMALGQDPVGVTKFFELDKYQSLLIAGTTGSGKSVFINTIISSILMRAKPNEVKLLLIDPKKVELGIYNGVSHLITPVVTDPKKASTALQKAVREMERRYDLFADSKTKNIETYNNYIKAKNKMLSDEEKISTLPYWVVIIDELYDLMVVCPKETEDSIMRITQMARAAGICLIVSTQIPSSKVITDTIKENMPNRISFDTANVIDSKNILDMPGAEKLFGKGDMLFLPKGEHFPQRIQGVFVSEEEISKLVDFCSSQQKAVYDENFTQESGSTTIEGFTSDKNDVEQDDPLYNETLEFVLSTRKASASLLQRKFKLGYNRAARLIDLFEERGIIGPQQGSKPREILYKIDDEH